MKGLDRCALISKRIERLLQKDDKNGLFKFMDVVTKIFTKRESIRILSSFLVTITKHHMHILNDYIEFFTSRNLFMTYLEYYSKPRDFPFPGFKPQHVEKSLQIANENGWIDESVLLFEHFSTFYSCKAEKDQHRARITEAIKNGAKLNFGVNIANRINNFCRDRDNALWYVMQWGLSRWTPAYLESNYHVTTNDFNMLLHSVSESEASAIFLDKSRDVKYCRIISFIGSRLVKYCFRQFDFALRIHKSFLLPRTKTFTGLVPAPESAQKTYLYHYYRAIVENDLERAKQIQLKHINNAALQELALPNSFRHPHPLHEYINRAESMQRDMVDYLVENFDGVAT
jgi:hypothetical protein